MAAKCTTAGRHETPNAAINSAPKSVDVHERFASLGAEPANTPAQFAAMVAADSAHWGRILKHRKITIK